MTNSLTALSGRSRPTLSDRVADELRTEVHSGVYGPGEQLPAEPELAQRFGVSRATIRSAITSLVSELLLEKRRGKGTFVLRSNGDPSHGFEQLVGITEAIRSLGKHPTVVNLTLDTLTASREFCETHGIDEGVELTQITRTWLVDSRPAVHGVDWVPLGVLGDRGSLTRFSVDQSLSARLAEHGVQIASAMSRIQPALAGHSVGAELDLAPTDPVLLIRQVHYDNGPDSRAVLYSDQYWGGRALQLHIVRRAVR